MNNLEGTLCKPLWKSFQVRAHNSKARQKIHLTNDELQRRFNFHPADTEEKKLRHEQVRDACLTAADTIVNITGAPSREQSLAISKMEEAMFWANAAIAREITAPQE